MTKDLKQRIRLIYSIALSAVIVIAGICLITACIGIYRSGDEPFTRESVAAAFSGIAIPVYLCLGMVIGGFVLALFLPGTAKKSAVQKQYGVILQRLRERTDLTQCDEALFKAIRAEQASRALHRRITTSLLVLGSVIFLVYALNGDHFHQTDINGSMVSAIWVLLPCMTVPFGYAVFTAYHANKSMQREIALFRQAEGAASPGRQEVCKAPSGVAVYLRYGLLAVAVAILIYGFCTGGTIDVLTKAINICTECVGLG